MVVVGCGKGSQGSSPGGATEHGGVSASGGQNSRGGTSSAGGAAGAQISGGQTGIASSGPGGAGGSSSATGPGGTSGIGGKASGGSAGASGTGGASGGGAGQGAGASGSGGTSGGAGAAGAQSGGTSASTGGQAGGGAGSGGSASSGGRATGGQVAGGKSSSGSAGSGGAATGGSTNNSGGQGGKATGGAGASSGSGGAATGGVSDTGGSSAGYHPCPSDGTACKIMPFGDSITDGYNSDTPGGYRVELFRLAHSAGKNVTFVGHLSNGPGSPVDGVTFPPNHEGHSGWTIYPTSSRSGISTCLSNGCGAPNQQSVMLTYTPHIVLLMIGTNDAIDNYDMSNAPKRLGDLIDTIYTQLPNVLIVVAQPIPSRGDASKGDDTALSARIKTYDDGIPAIVKARADAGKHILAVDMYTPFNPDKTSLLEDQWHPNLQGYVLLATQWYSVLQSLL